MDEHSIFYPPPPDWTYRWCTAGRHHAPTKASGDTRRWHGRQCPECTRAYMRTYTHERRADPEYREQLNAYRRNLQAKLKADPEYREQVNAYQRKLRAKLKADPEYRRQHNAKKRGYNNTPKGRAAKAADKARRKQHVRDAVCQHGRKCWQTAWQDILSQPDSRCAVPHCQQQDLTADHIVPLASGGLNCRDNLQPLCRWHNGVKGALSQEQFLRAAGANELAH